MAIRWPNQKALGGELLDVRQFILLYYNDLLDKTELIDIGSRYLSGRNRQDQNTDTVHELIE